MEMDLQSCMGGYLLESGSLLRRAQRVLGWNLSLVGVLFDILERSSM
jgi:hypothetical protein